MSETKKPMRTTLIKRSDEPKKSIDIPSDISIVTSNITSTGDKKLKIKIKTHAKVASANSVPKANNSTESASPTNENSSEQKAVTVKTHVNPNRRINTVPEYKSKENKRDSSKHSADGDRKQEITAQGSNGSQNISHANNQGIFRASNEKTSKDNKFSKESNAKKNQTSSSYSQQNLQKSDLSSKPKTNDSKESSSVSDSSQSSKRSFKATRKKQFVNKRKQFVEKNIHFTKNKKTAPIVVTNPVPKSISIMESISVVDLAKKMNLKSSELLSKLMAMGMMANLNSVIDYETAQLLASEYECEINVISLYDQTLIETKSPVQERTDIRPPVVTIMGHVDHGKTTLIDCLRKSKVVDSEQGQITQHLGAYTINTGTAKITMLDTPGHEAFTLMRSRGAQITDIVILVIAADDGIKPQTIEAISHAKAAGVPIVVALNKIDLPNSNSDRVLHQLAEQELMPEEWGGNIPVYRISALKNEGIDNLLEQISLQAELMNILANNLEPAKGVVLESKMEKGRGTVISVLIKTGTLRIGDFFVSGIFPGKVRDIIDDMGNSLREATPSMPVAIVGIDGMPDAGDPFEVTDTERNAKLVSAKRQELNKITAGESVKKVTADTLYDSMEEDSADTLNIIVKGDVHGSVEAIKEALEKLSQEEVKVKVLQASAGSINAADIQLAAASTALVIGFNVRPSIQVQRFASQEKVVIQRYSLIFDVIDAIRKQIEGMLKPIYKEEKTGEAVVREVFSVPKFGLIAGSYIESGGITKDSIVKIMRNKKEIHKGNVISLKRFKDDVNKVDTGYECGIAVDSASDIQESDVFMIYKKVAIARTIQS